MMVEVRRVSMAAVLLLPGALVLYFAFNSGGFHPGATAYAAVLLCLLCALRVALARHPFAGVSRSVGLVVGCLALYSVLALASGFWSHAAGVARIEFDLPLVYLLTALLLGSVPRTRDRLRWMLRGLLIAAFVVCASGLITRLLPQVWPTTPTIANNRLSFPVTYWNVLGLVAVMGIVLSVHMCSDLREPRVGRVLTAGALPVLATTLFFTFSRGAIATCVICVFVYLLLGRPRGLPSTAVGVVPPTAIAIIVAYNANQLASVNPTTPAAVSQGHRVAIVVALCALAAAGLRAALAFTLDRRMATFSLPEHVRRPVGRAAWAALVAAGLILIVALNGTIASQARRFVQRSSVGTPTDLRQRLTDPANRARVEQWKLAWRQFKSDPVLGQGAGTFQDSWAQYRPGDGPFARDAHSLYMETLDELGLVGLVLLLTVIVTILVRVAQRARGRGRTLYAAVFSVLLAWAIHAGVDWDWEMPVVTIVFFGLGAFTLTHRALTDGRPTPRRVGAAAAMPWSRVAVAVPLLLLAVLPAATWISQRDLDNAAYAFAQGDCGAARSSAMASISALGNRAEPYELVSYCDLRLGLKAAALSAIHRAVSLDPKNWNYRYGLAVMRAASGLDPRAAAREALLLNPHEPLVQQEWQAFRTGSPASWRVRGDAIARSFTSL